MNAMPKASEGSTMAVHGTMSGTHSHVHSPYGGQGDDETHEHQHVHDGDNKHDHTHGASMQAAAELSAEQITPGRSWPLGMRSFVRMPADVTASGFEIVTAAGEPILDVASQMLALGATWGIAQIAPGQYRVLNADLQADGGPAVSAWQEADLGSYVGALEVVAEQMAADRPVLADRWRSDLAFENVETGDGRFINGGGIQYRDCPLPFMLQTVTQGGHDGAVLAGTIERTGMMGTTAVGAGSYDDSEAGRQSVAILAARGRFGVSIDVAEAEGAPVCAQHGDNLDDCTYDCDISIHFSLIKVMGATQTPFPAFENAFVELDANASQDDAVAADAAVVEHSHSQPCACQTGNATVANSTGHLVTHGNLSAAGGTVRFDVGGWLPNGVTATGAIPPAATTSAIVAAGGPAIPPAEWFEDPGFSVGDGRLVRQPDGHYVCPLTVTPDGRVFGHFAGRYQCHTGKTDRCVTMPHSDSNYAAFHLRPIETTAGELLVGHISMGTGHADVRRGMTVADVRAHYDGGPGAVLCAKVRCGEDAFGGWFAGSLHEDLTDAQVRRFRGLSVSGDWRQVWENRGLDLLACLAGVPVPGFPVAALAAAGYVLASAADVELDALPEAFALFSDDGAPLALIASGVVRQPFPWERAMAHQQEEIDQLRSDVGKALRVIDQLRPLAATALVAKVKEVSGV